MKNIELLQLEMDVLWGREIYGRHRSSPLFAIAVADDGTEMRFEPGMQAPLQDRLRRLGMAAFDRPEILNDLGSTRIGRGPSFVFASKSTNYEVPDPLRILTSKMELPSHLPSSLDPWWEADEWSDLLAGKIGPWAMGIIGGQIVSICHTPAAGEMAAEAGTWTHPDHRGRGWAAAVASAWASVARERFGTLFYSTSFDNLASQAVARKLGLQRIGEIWQLVRA